MEDRARDPAALTRCAAARIAEAEYRRLEEEVRRDGMDAAVIRANANHLTERRGDEWLVTERAYLPTAVALGCPLDPTATAELRRAATSIDGLAHVPANAYHITVVNRAHYEHSAPAFLSLDEFRAVRECIARLNLREIAVDVAGFLITAHGKVFLKCLPVDDSLLELRTRLVDAVPALAINVPKTAHIKLAHVRVPTSGVPPPVSLSKLIFRDVYTPHGRIPLEAP